MRKHFILSTRTLVSKRDVTQSFGSDNTVYVPLAVMEEIEKRYYDQPNERGKIARSVLAYLGSFHIDDLKKGVVQKNGSILKVNVGCSKHELPKEVSESECSKLDYKILQTCLDVKEEVPKNEPVVLISKKDTLRKKAEMLGIMAQTFKDELLPEIPEQYTGRKIVHADDAKIKEFREKRTILINEILTEEQRYDIVQNMFIEFRGKYEKEKGRVQDDRIVALVYERYYPYGVIPKNNGQEFMIEALMLDYEIAPLVIIKGPAGTAKTFLSLAVGLDLVEQDKFQNKILISRSATEIGEKIGFLPGSEIDKISPYLRGTMDNLVALHRKEDYYSSRQNRNRSNRASKSFEINEKPLEEDGTAIFERGLIKAEAIGYIRGRSICDTYIIIDEAQNLSPMEIKTIITRSGTGSKMIILGDPAQIDRPDLDERNNGLSYASERLKGEKTCFQLTMRDDESVRSEVAKRASILL